MKIKTIKKIASHDGLLVVPVFKDETKKIPGKYSPEIKEFIKKRAKDDGFEGKKDEVYKTYLDDKNLPKQLAIIGFDEEKELNARSARDFGAKIGKVATNTKEITLVLPVATQKFAQEIVEGLIMSQYKFDKFKSKKDKKEKETKELETLYIVPEQKDKNLDSMIKSAQLNAEAVEYVKDLVNSPAHYVDANYLAEEAKKIAKENKYKLAVFGLKELKKMGWGGLIAVNQGAKDEPKAIVLEYNGSKDKREKPTVIVGKGMIFDSGGYNLKPTNYIETMHQDMAGAAVVLGVFKSLKKLGVRKNVIGIIPAAENMINDKAYRPSDILTMLSGDTVEINNTDAEGRLILADGISYSQKFDPARILTIATLTGAVFIALGNRYAGLLGNNEDLVGELRRAGESVDDLAWALPIHEDYKKRLDSKVADMKNCDEARDAGASTAAAFLEKFVGKKDWCHIDIGGTAFTKMPKEYEQNGATAHGLRMLLRYLGN